MRQHELASIIFAFCIAAKIDGMEFGRCLLLAQTIIATEGELATRKYKP